MSPEDIKLGEIGRHRANAAGLGLSSVWERGTGVRCPEPGQAECRRLDFLILE